MDCLYCKRRKIGLFCYECRDLLNLMYLSFYMPRKKIPPTRKSLNMSKKSIPMIGFYNIALKIHEYIPLNENKPITPNCISFKMIKSPFTGACN